MNEILDWDEFIKNIISNDKIWSGCADSSVNIYPGNKVNDSTAHNNYLLGTDGNIHAICVGKENTGKNMFIQQLIASLTREYSPTELTLYLCDYKNSFSNAFIVSKDNMHMLPHIRELLCGRDINRVLAMFKNLRQETEYRYDLLNNTNDYLDDLKYRMENVPVQKNLSERNKYWRELAEKEDIADIKLNCMPRILFICSSFKEVYDSLDSTQTNELIDDIVYILKWGYCTNVSMLLMSESFSNTLSADYLRQFTLKFVFKTSMAISKSLLGNLNAAEMWEKSSYMYVSANGIDVDNQPKFQMPVISCEILRSHIQTMSGRV